RQSGVPELAVANLARDADLISVAQVEARAIVDADPRLEHPEHRTLVRALEERWEGRLAPPRGGERRPTSRPLTPARVTPPPARLPTRPPPRLMPEPGRTPARPGAAISSSASAMAPIPSWSFFPPRAPSTPPAAPTSAPAVRSRTSCAPIPSIVHNSRVSSAS